MEVIRSKIEVQVYKGTEFIEAACLGCFGVHPDLDERGRFTVTHLPTGLALTEAIGLFASEAEAIECVRSLSTLCDWSSDDPTAYPENLREKAAALGRIHNGSLSRRGHWGPIRPIAPLNGEVLRPCVLATSKPSNRTETR